MPEKYVIPLNRLDKSVSLPSAKVRSPPDRISP